MTDLIRTQLKSGTGLKDIWKMEDISAVAAGNFSLTSLVYLTWDDRVFENLFFLLSCGPVWPRIDQATLMKFPKKCCYLTEEDLNSI